MSLECSHCSAAIPELSIRSRTVCPTCKTTFETNVKAISIVCLFIAAVVAVLLAQIFLKFGVFDKNSDFLFLARVLFVPPLFVGLYAFSRIAGLVQIHTDKQVMNKDQPSQTDINEG